MPYMCSNHQPAYAWLLNCECYISPDVSQVEPRSVEVGISVIQHAAIAWWEMRLM